jgi:peptide chain release factor subunit 1
VGSPDRELLRKLADWPTGGLPVTTLYLDADGRRYPRGADVQRHAELLLRKVAPAREAPDRDGARSAARDVELITDYLRDRFDRRGAGGLAVFSCAGAGLWQDQPLSRPIRDRVAIRPAPYLLPLEALVERAESIGVVLVDREKARIVLSRLGEVEEVTRILDDVPGQHDRGGWAQARLGRHIDDHVQRHLKRVAGALLQLQRDGRFDHLVLAGPEEVVAELERELHDYVRRTVVDRATLPLTAPLMDVQQLAAEVEARLEREREEKTIRRLVEGAAHGRAVLGLDATLPALPESRVDTLVVAAGLEAEGVRCPACGRLAPVGARCPLCGAPTVPEPELIEAAVEAALRGAARVETIPPEADGAAHLNEAGAIGALLRF